MNLGAPMQYGMATPMLAVAAASTVADPFDKSPLNPVNMSRTTATSAAASHAPSAKLLERVRVAAADLAELACVQAGWRYVTDKNNATVYEMNGAMLPSTVSVAASFGGRAGGKASDYYLVKSVTTIRADADRVLDVLATPTTETFALRMNQLFGRHYQNAVVIDHMSCTAPPASFRAEDGSLHTYTQDDAYAVHWLSLRSPSSGDNSRDFTFASYQDVFQRDPHGALSRLGRRAAATAATNPLASSSASVTSSPQGGRLLGVHALTSFNFKDIPELPRHKHTDRLHVRTSGFVVEETHERGVFRLSLFLSLTPSATTLRNPKKYDKWLQTLALSVGNLALQLQHPHEIQTPPSQQIQWKHSDHCALCLKSFRTFRRCHHCRFCGESVCNKCSGFVDASKTEVVEALRGRSRAASTATDRRSEVRGCTRCIHTLLDDVAIIHHGSSVCDVRSRASTTESHSSSHINLRNSRLAGSFVSDHQQQQQHPVAHRQPPSPFVLHQYDDDDLSSIGSSSTDGRGYASRSSPAHQHDALTLDDLEGYTWSGAVKTPPQMMPPFVRPPRDPKHALSMSQASTTQSRQSYEDLAPLRGSAANHHDTLDNQTPLPAPRVPSPEDDEYTPGASVMAMHGDDLDKSRHVDHLDLHDHDADDDTFARSMVSYKSNHPTPASRLTSSSTTSAGSGSFKFSMMSAHSFNSEPEQEPTNDSFASNLSSQQHAVAPAPPTPALPSVKSSSKLFSISSSSRLYSQSRPPRPPPSVSSGDRGRSSSTTSSAASLRAPEEMMISLPPAALAAAGGLQNDMILLAPAMPRSPKFVEFSDSRRESICVRPDNGSDMIPLRF